jgi:hypothetical protein
LHKSSKKWLETDEHDDVTQMINKKLNEF